MTLEFILSLEIMKKIVGPVGSAQVTVHGKPPNSNGHNFFVRNPFRMFLNYMESPLSLESIHI